jgi:lysophospholipase L1-like esterase
MKNKFIKNLFKKTLIMLLVLVSLLNNSVTVFAISPEQKKIFDGGIRYFDYEESCIPVANSTENSSVYVIGDSLTVGMRDMGGLNEKLSTAGWKVLDIEATNGITTSGSIAKIDEDSELIKQSSTVVVALGTNKENNFGNAVKSMIDKIKTYSQNAQIYWVNAYAPGYNYDDINAVISAQSTPLNYKVIDWKAEAEANQAKYEFSNVHQSPKGYALKSDFLVSSLTPGKQPFGTVPTTANQPISGTNRGYNGEEVFSQEDLNKIEQNKPFYLVSSQSSDVPWQLIAVIHKRESGLGRNNPGNGQGIYQFYNKEGGPYPAGPVSDGEFQRQTDILSKRLQQDYVTRNHPKNLGPLRSSGTPDNVIKDTLFSYNGRSDKYKKQAIQLGFTDESQGYEGSPYVMNKADAKRDPATAAPGTWGQVKVDRGPIVYPANKDWGAWPQFAALTGMSGDFSTSSCGSTSKSSGGVVVDGYAYPIGPHKKGELASPPPCNKTTCHHDGTPAWDLFVKGGGDKTTGTPVYAISDGVIKNVRDTYKGIAGCNSFQLVSSKDNFYYWYGHISNATVSNNQTVGAGQQIAEVGPRKCTGNGSSPHLHIDRGCIKGGQPKPGGGDSCRDPGIIELLNKLYEGLPE